MTMVPAQSLSRVKQHQQQRRRRQQRDQWHGGYGSCGESFGLMNRLEGYGHFYNCVLEYSGLDVANCNNMAEDESRTNSLNNEAGSSSKDGQGEKDEGWLQLGIGGLTSTSHDSQSSRNKNDVHDHQEDPTSTARRGGLRELDLLPPPGGSSSNQVGRPLLSSPIFHLPDEFRAHPRQVMNIPGAASFSTSLFFQPHPGLGSPSTYPPSHLHQQDVNWPFRPTITMPPYNTATAPPSSSSALMPLGAYFSRPLHQFHSGIDIAGPSSDFRIIDPPRRPHAGIWFMLQASQNQSKEPFLPQVSKSYLRIKDGRMTVRLIMKYLVNKLKLDSESEVEITCRGQQLLPFLTLQHVRDNIWSPGDAVTLLPAESSTTDHVMVLHYGRMRGA